MRKFNGKKVLAIAAAAMLATSMFGSSITAMAATVSVEGTTGHPISDETEFTFYKIFNVIEGVDGTGKTVYNYTLNSAYADYVRAVLNMDATVSDDDVIEKVGTLNPDETRAFADALKDALKNVTGDFTIAKDSDGEFKKSDAENGYYLMTDNGMGYVTSLCALGTASDNETLEIKVKGDYPEVVKKVKEDDTYTVDGGWGEGYNDVADYNINEDVPFSFTTTVPMMEGFGDEDAYKMVFHDTMSEGLTFNADSVTVTIGSKTLVVDVDFTVETENLSGDETFTVTIPALNQIDGIEFGDTIRVEFTGKLNENAVIGLDGNTNTVVLEYSNNPYEDTTKKTPEDKVVVFTFGTDVNKTNAAGEMLAGAKFKLYTEKNADGTVNVDSEIKLTAEENGVYVVADKAAEGVEIVSDGINHIVIKGLDSGTYYLDETAAPEGYNKLSAPIEITIIATYIADRQNWEAPFTAEDALTKLQGSFAGEEIRELDATAGLIDGTVVNKTGSLLPETGGIGTTIFYIAGTLLMAGAVFFITAKGRKKEDEA